MDKRIAMGIVSPLHVQRKPSANDKDLDDIQRSFSTLNNVKKEGDHSGQPTDTRHRKLYGMPLPPFLSYRKGDSMPEQVRN